MSLISLIEQTNRDLEAADIHFGQGTLSARDEATWLVLWAAHLPLNTDLNDAAFHTSPTNTHVSPALQAKIQALVQRRIKERLPAAYLTQEAWLQGIAFYVDERVIIPRSLLAEVIAQGTADAWINPEATSALDLCTGNGSLAVLAAMAWPDLHITASDISVDALAVAQINVQKHGLQERVTLLQSDGAQIFLQDGKRFDLIICNPPYVNAHSMANLPAEFKAEPHLALAGGSDGMDFIRPLIALLSHLLTEHGILLLEIGHERLHFEAAFPRLSPIWLETSAGEDGTLLLTREMLS